MPIWIPWRTSETRRKKRQENNNNGLVWTHKPAWYVLIACIVRYVLLMSQAKFMLCTRLRNDTPVSMYTIHTISHKCSLFQTASAAAAAAAAPTTHTVKSNRSWQNSVLNMQKWRKNQQQQQPRQRTDRRTHILSHETIITLTHTIIIRIGSIGVYEWVTFTVLASIAMIILIQTMMMSELRKSGLFTSLEIRLFWLLHFRVERTLHEWVEMWTATT